eukprot:TRINITY_DN13726_c0_g2_i2.p1 TRINITY_DN13726_c0_g2~~TRINITY_DN13726_c0_g2_i2.p1  ORF type:complete len:158 (-),score=16.24 TRINITY_DN13726_c0_g2_i2:1411-1884(-)
MFQRVPVQQSHINQKLTAIIFKWQQQITKTILVIKSLNSFNGVHPRIFAEAMKKFSDGAVAMNDSATPIACRRMISPDINGTTTTTLSGHLAGDSKTVFQDRCTFGFVQRFRLGIVDNEDESPFAAHINVARALLLILQKRKNELSHFLKNNCWRTP